MIRVPGISRGLMMTALISAATIAIANRTGISNRILAG